MASHFILISSTAENSATSGSVVVLERFGQNEEPPSWKKEWAKKKPRFAPSIGFISEANCKHLLVWTLSIIIFVLYYVFYLYLVRLLVYSSDRKSFWSFAYVIIYCVGADLITLMSISYGLDPYFFLSKDGKDEVYERRSGRRIVYFPSGVCIGLL